MIVSLTLYIVSNHKSSTIWMPCSSRDSFIICFKCSDFSDDLLEQLRFFCVYLENVDDAVRARYGDN